MSRDISEALTDAEGKRGITLPAWAIWVGTLLGGGLLAIAVPWAAWVTTDCYESPSWADLRAAIKESAEREHSRTQDLKKTVDRLEELVDELRIELARHRKAQP